VQRIVRDHVPLVACLALLADRIHAPDGLAVEPRSRICEGEYEQRSASVWIARIGLDISVPSTDAASSSRALTMVSVPQSNCRPSVIFCSVAGAAAVLRTQMIFYTGSPAPLYLLRAALGASSMSGGGPSATGTSVMSGPVTGPGCAPVPVPEPPPDPAAGSHG
jgi:hypothetical protein